ncbi:reverse transcriptase domain-containing protein, partial [Tanacetum coccineum]
MPTTTRSGMTPAAIEEMIERRVMEALEAYEANINRGLGMKSRDEHEDDNGDDHVNGNGGGNGNRGGNGDGNPNMNAGGVVPVTRETIVTDVAYAMTWKELMKLMMEGNNLAAYTQRFQELILLCTKMVPKEEDRVEKFIGGLQDAIWIANNLMDQKLKGYVVRNAKNKRRFDSNQSDNRVQQPPVKRQDMGRAYTVGSNEKKGYSEPFPYCNKCRLHHVGQCTVKYGHCKKVRHMTRDCKAAVTATTQRALVANQQVVTCYECGEKGYYRSDYPKLKNRNYGNKNGTNEARGRAYALGGGEANLNSNVVTGTFLLNNRYASILFDLGVDRSFVSTTFSTLINVIPSTLNVSYAVELADGRVTETNVILRGCTLGLLGHPFNIDLMPIELGSFDVIIGMDWMAKYHAVIVCDEKIICFPYGNEVLIIQGDVSDRG